MIARDIYITGIVQGVGMRPSIMRVALKHDIAGWVLNSLGGVHIHALAAPSVLDDFEQELQENFPVQARIESYTSIAGLIEAEDKLDEFFIKSSDAQEESPSFVSPDIATCNACEQELFDPKNRRYHYPFINCTDCGPRYSVIDSLPYDRANTSMASFEMCDECQAEYDSYHSRRHHAQPNACFICGPQISLRIKDVCLDVQGQSLEERRQSSDELIEQAAQLICQGNILAIKGLGGYHLACDATNEQAVAELRTRKHRFGKALAVMMPNLSTAQSVCDIQAKEAELLSASIRPIVLCRIKDLDSGAKKAGKASLIAPNVYQDLVELGIMLPYTPLHHLLLASVKRPLVMTSANLSEEPLVKDDDEALRELAHLADAFLMHNRPILQRIDDSVVRVLGDTVQLIRRARGYAPAPLKLPKYLDKNAQILAAGPEQKHSFALSRHNIAFVSEHIGDMENRKTLDAFSERLEGYERILRYKPTHIAVDSHPEYISTKYARELAAQDKLPLIEVQHHRAHIASVLAEHAVSDTCFGIALDGTGLGDDQKLWGGEIFVGDYKDLKRVGHLSYLKLAGGQAAIKNPWRIALGALKDFDLLAHPGAAQFMASLDAQESSLVQRMIDKGINTAYASSAGRLLDSLSALIGLCPQARYEGEAAIVLEACAHRLDHKTQSLELKARSYLPYTLSLSEEGELNSYPMFKACLDDLARNVRPQLISWRIHHALIHSFIEALKPLSKRYNTTIVALSGGCFMNRILAEGFKDELTKRGYTVLSNQNLPPNDGCISYGQLAYALTRI
ncbi:MAG: carbamoyltransferase HypF [Coriobacteriia bacterium]|nr:carbamoyltransferase HypF [Coriobacteriia bacterium]